MQTTEEHLTIWNGNLSFIHGLHNLIFHHLLERRGVHGPVEWKLMIKKGLS